MHQKKREIGRGFTRSIPKYICYSTIKNNTGFYTSFGKPPWAGTDCATLIFEVVSLSFLASMIAPVQSELYLQNANDHVE